MSRRFSPLNLAFTLGMLGLGACDESPNPTDPIEPSSAIATSAVRYSVRNLEVRSIGEGGNATSINDAGQVVGYIFRPDDAYRGFIWQNGVSTDLGTLGGDQTWANDINEIGQVVGSSENGVGRRRAYRWKDGRMVGLGSLGGRESDAHAINNKGQIVGSSQLTGVSTVHAFLYQNGVMKDLGTLGGLNSVALDINDAGQVVGWSQTRNGTRHPFLWENGVMKDLLSPGSTATGTAYAINPFGVVVGEKNNHAFRYSNGVMGGLGLANMGPSVATDIRNGRVVGLFSQGAFVVVGGEVTVLPVLPGVTSSAAHALNRAGVIVGGTYLEDSGHAEITMWTPQ